jgi:ferredoxin-NADP reductase
MHYDLAAGCDIVLVHSQRRPADVPYRDELAWMARQLPGLRVHYLCSDSSLLGHQRMQMSLLWHQRTQMSPLGHQRMQMAADDPAAHLVAGRLGPDVLARLVPDLAAREAFACGPTSYRETARAAASALGCAPQRFHEESFTFEASEPVRPAGQNGALGEFQVEFQVEFRDLGVTIPCAAGTTVLDAAAAAGLTLPSSCTQGLCGTCKSTLIAGQVDMQHNGGIRPREVAAGKVLLCCSRPLSDLVVSA